MFSLRETTAVLECHGQVVPHCRGLRGVSSTHFNSQRQSLPISQFSLAPSAGGSRSLSLAGQVANSHSVIGSGLGSLRPRTRGAEPVGRGGEQLCCRHQRVIPLRAVQKLSRLNRQSTSCTRIVTSQRRRPLQQQNCFIHLGRSPPCHQRSRTADSLRFPPQPLGGQGSGSSGSSSIIRATVAELPAAPVATTALVSGNALAAATVRAVTARRPRTDQPSSRAARLVWFPVHSICVQFTSATASDAAATCSAAVAATPSAATRITRALK